MSTRTPANCPHELRPGTTVCLHCLAVERAAARQKAKRTALRLVALGLVAAAGTLGAGKLASVSRGERADSTAAADPAVMHDGGSEAAPVGEPASEPAPASTTPAGSPSSPSPTFTVSAPVGATPTFRTAAAVSEPAPAALRPTAPVAAALRPRIREGTSELGGGMMAERHGDTVRVHFDTELNRTRRADKFERIVRATLPRVYGAPAEAALAADPTGALVAGDLTGELPRRGVHVRLVEGGMLSLWPATRPGRDGPLVVTYVATIAH